MTNPELLDFPHLKVRDEGSWRENANCKGVPTSVFFSGLGTSPASQKKRIPALECCNACKVRKECLEFAVNNDIKHGIYGGLTPTERKNLSESFCNGSEETV